MEAIINRIKKAWFISTAIVCLLSGTIQAQYKILPLGNSITWGKAHQSAPIPGEYGYRDHLYVNLSNAGYTVEFVGPQESGPYDGEWHDGATIEQYIPDAYFPSYSPDLQPQPNNPFDIEITLDNLRMAGKFPDIVLLHIGTNDMNSDQAISGGFRVTIMEELELLLQALLDYNEGGSEIDNIFLCKIIPRAPFNDYPGANARILDYNSKIDLIYNELTNDEQKRVTVINMHAALYSDQNRYYGSDDGPVEPFDDHVHPNEDGYVKMADVFSMYIENELSLFKRDEFSAIPQQLNDYANWSASASILTTNTQGGYIYTWDVGSAWNDLAIWHKSKGLNSITMGYHENSSSDNTYTSGVGLLVACDTTDISIVNGYMVFVYDGYVRLHKVVNGNVSSQIQRKPFLNPRNGDSLSVNFIITETRTNFSVQLMNEINPSPSNPKEVIFEISDYASKPPLYPDKDYYSGITFRGSTPEAKLKIDFIKAKTTYEDLVSPNKITDFLPISKTPSSITLQWTAVGDDGFTGQASSYDIRYSTKSITTDNFGDVSIVGSIPQPADCGDGSSRPTQSVTIEGLLANTVYYFAIRTIDDWGNSGDLSTTVSYRTEKRNLVSDEFESSSIFENNWIYNPDEYKINEDTDEMYNDYATEDWGGLAIYKNGSNPTEVRMVWGDNVQDPERGEKANGGFVVLASDTSTTANGYLIFIRNLLDVIYLFRIDNGIITDPDDSRLDVVPLDIENLGDYPGAGDTLAVIIYTSNESYNRFDLFVKKGTAGSSWKAASRFALYDYDKLFGKKQENYAGLMLTQKTNNQDNAVASFATSFMRTNADRIEAASPVSLPPDTVNTKLDEELEVRVYDKNNILLPEWPVFFNVIQGDGSVGSGEFNNNRIYIEAEWYTSIETPMVVIEDQNASGDKYIKSSEETPDRSGYAEYKIYIDQAGVYTLYARTKWLQNDYKGWNFYIVFDEGTEDEEEFMWFIQQKQGGSPEWVWDVVQVDHKGEYFSRQLSKGMHTLQIRTVHADVPLDKLLLTREEGYITVPDDDPINAVLTDDNGTAKTSWILGTTADDKSTPNTNEGINQIIARPFGAESSVTFEAEGLPDKPSSLLKLNNNQFGNAGEQLQYPFIVTLRDAYQNKVPDYTVNFEIVNSLDGSLSELSVLTNEYGQASTYLTLGCQDTLYEVLASFEGYTGEQIKFSARVNKGSGLVGDLLPVSLQADGRLYINEEFTNILQAKILDDAIPPNPIENTPVSFEVIKGHATVIGDKYYTNNLGIAKGDITMGPDPEEVIVIAHTSLHSDTVLIDTAFYKISEIYMPQGSGNNQKTNAGTVFKYPLKIYASSPTGAPAGGVPIIFETKGHGFECSGGGEVAFDTTSFPDGTASIKVRAGQYHGKYKDIVEVMATDGFYPVKGSPKNFTLYVSSDADKLVKIEGDSLSGVVGEIIGPLKVKMIDSEGEPVVNQPLTYKVTAGDGYFSGKTPKDSLIFHSDHNGLASAWLTLGPKVGVYNNEVTVYFDNAYNHREVKFNLSAVVSSADTMFALSPLHIEGVVGKSVNVKVRVFDDTRPGNPVKDVSVYWSVINGGGFLTEVGDTTTVVATDDSGKASIDWILGNKAGEDNNVLKIYATDGVNVLNGAPIYFYASAEPDSVDPDSSLITASASIEASGKDSAEVIVTLYDKYNNPISGKTVTIKVTPKDRVHIYGPHKPTDEKGQTTASFVSYSAGEKVVYALVTDEDIQLNSTDTVNVSATEAAYIKKYNEENCDHQTGNIHTVLKYPLKVEVTDANQNPKQGVPVTFQVTDGGGEIVEKQPVLSDEDGLAQSQLILGSEAGLNTVEVTADVSIVSSLNFEATAEDNEAYKIDNVTPLALNGKAGVQLTDTLKVRVVDNKDRFVYGVLVNFEVEGGGEVSHTSMHTNEYGEAWTLFTAGDISGTQNYVKAINRNLAGSPVEFKVFVSSGLPRKIDYVDLGDKSRQGYLESNIQVEALVTDKFGNKVKNVPITFTIITGDASIQGNQEYTLNTNTGGLANATVTLGESVETVIIEARNKLLQGSPLEFIIYPQPDQALEMIIVRGNNQKGTVGHILPDPLMVRVVDQFGNPVSATSVTFAKDGDGEIIGAQPVLSDSNGHAMVKFRAGNTAGEAVITAVSKNVVVFNVEAVANEYFPVISNKQQLLDDVPYQINENNPWPLTLAVYASDNDRQDILSFQAYQEGYVDLPEGAEITKNTATTATFTWTPNNKQSGTYSIVLRVTDGKGGYDTVTLPIEVINNNRIPTIKSTLPVSRDTTVDAGCEVMFWIKAEDPDRDPLTYRWEVDGQEVQNNNYAVYYYKIDEDYNGKENINVKVRISDDGGVSYASEYTWSLEIIIHQNSSIQLASYFIQFDRSDHCVDINWSTSFENYNRGFDVLRSVSQFGLYHKINNYLIESNENGSYLYKDRQIQVGVTYFYKIVDIDESGYRTEHNPLMIKIPAPERYILSQNYPNPFNPVTKIHYEVPKAGMVNLSVYNMMGQQIKVLIDEFITPGFYEVDWDGKNEQGIEVSTGIYIYRLFTKDKTLIKRMVKLK